MYKKRTPEPRRVRTGRVVQRNSFDVGEAKIVARMRKLRHYIRAEGKDYGDAAVGYVEVKREGNLCQVRGKICPEHRVNNKPYSVSMLVNEEIEKVEYVRCEDCAASEGGCKHAVAFLMWVHRRSEEPEPIAIPYATGKNQY
ncbi:hypothetical protein ALC62_10759 [Cyphomyrmex costatus]|uniref:SWIM-type domain-containing protein n=1 Tax=Cyphomyrmex costatus TaxID=456900 RepID=A0A151IDW0_9HYME|nr:hypothetical protein ALC62_10759 [Cyphomyrmex costatus]